VFPISFYKRASLPFLVIKVAFKASVKLSFLAFNGWRSDDRPPENTF